MTSTGGPAFPRIEGIEPTGIGGNKSVTGTNGMYLRQWYAGMALQGLLAADRLALLIDQDVGEFGYLHENPYLAAEKAFAMADAMIAHELEGK